MASLPGGAGKSVHVSPAMLKQIRDLGDELIQKYINDFHSADAKISAEAAKVLLSLGWTKRDNESAGIIELLLEDARRGEFGEQAKVFAATAEVVSDADEGLESGPLREPPELVLVVDSPSPVPSSVPPAAVGVLPPPIEVPRPPADLPPSAYKEKPRKLKAEREEAPKVRRKPKNLPAWMKGMEKEAIHQRLAEDPPV